MTYLVFYAISALLLAGCVWILARPLLPSAKHSNANTPTPSINKRIALGIVILLPLASAGLYVTYGNVRIIHEPWLALPTNQQTLIDSLVEARKKLHEDPKNLRLILGIARGEVLLQRFQPAIELYQQAQQLAGKVAEVVIPYADALTMQNNGQVPADALSMLNELHQSQPTNPEVLWILAAAATQRGDSSTALNYWQQLLPLVEKNTPEIAARIRTEMAKLQSDFQLEVQIKLDPQFVVQPNTVLFVSAHQVLDNGMVTPMPIAAKRLEQFSFPLSVTLSESDSLRGDKLLSAYQKIEIRAKISTSGNATPSTGDFIGTNRLVLEKQSTSTVIIINRVQ